MKVVLPRSWLVEYFVFCKVANGLALKSRNATKNLDRLLPLQPMVITNALTNRLLPRTIDLVD